MSEAAIGRRRLPPEGSHATPTSHLHHHSPHRHPQGLRAAARMTPPRSGIELPSIDNILASARHRGPDRRSIPGRSRTIGRSGTSLPAKERQAKSRSNERHAWSCLVPNGQVASPRPVQQHPPNPPSPEGRALGRSPTVALSGDLLMPDSCSSSETRVPHTSKVATSKTMTPSATYNLSRRAVSTPRAEPKADNRKAVGPRNLIKKLFRFRFLDLQPAPPSLTSTHISDEWKSRHEQSSDHETLRTADNDPVTTPQEAVKAPEQLDAMARQSELGRAATGLPGNPPDDRSPQSNGNVSLLDVPSRGFFQAGSNTTEAIRASVEQAKRTGVQRSETLKKRKSVTLALLYDEDPTVPKPTPALAPSNRLYDESAQLPGRGSLPSPRKRNRSPGKREPLPQGAKSGFSMASRPARLDRSGRKLFARNKPRGLELDEMRTDAKMRKPVGSTNGSTAHRHPEATPPWSPVTSFASLCNMDECFDPIDPSAEPGPDMRRVVTCAGSLCEKASYRTPRSPSILHSPASPPRGLLKGSTTTRFRSSASRGSGGVPHRSRVGTHDNGDQVHYSGTATPRMKAESMLAWIESSGQPTSMETLSSNGGRLSSYNSSHSDDMPDLDMLDLITLVSGRSGINHVAPRRGMSPVSFRHDLASEHSVSQDIEVAPSSQTATRFKATPWHGASPPTSEVETLRDEYRWSTELLDHPRLSRLLSSGPPFTATTCHSACPGFNEDSLPDFIPYLIVRNRSVSSDSSEEENDPIADGNYSSKGIEASCPTSTSKLPGSGKNEHLGDREGMSVSPQPHETAHNEPMLGASLRRTSTFESAEIASPRPRCSSLGDLPVIRQNAVASHTIVENGTQCAPQKEDAESLGSRFQRRVGSAPHGTTGFGAPSGPSVFDRRRPKCATTLKLEELSVKALNSAWKREQEWFFCPSLASVPNDNSSRPLRRDRADPRGIKKADPQ